MNVFIFVYVNSDLRCKLPELGLVGFIGNGSCLPRKSPVDDTPLTTADVRILRQPFTLLVNSSLEKISLFLECVQSPNVVLFKSPPELEIEVSLPNQGTGKCIRWLLSLYLELSAVLRIMKTH